MSEEQAVVIAAQEPEGSGRSLGLTNSDEIIDRMLQILSYPLNFMLTPGNLQTDLSVTSGFFDRYISNHLINCLFGSRRFK